MAVTHGIQVTGSANNVVPEVEAASKAMRILDKPVSPGLRGGWFNISGAFKLNNSSTNNKTPAASPIFAVRNGMPGTIMQLKRLYVSVGLVTAPIAGVWTFTLTKASNFYGMYASNNAATGPITLPTQMPPQRLRSQFVNFGSVGTYDGFTTADTIQESSQDAVAISCTGGAQTGTVAWQLTNGTLSLESQAFAAATVSDVATAGRCPGDGYNRGQLPLWDSSQGDQPMELAEAEGFVLRYTTTGAYGASDVTASASVQAYLNYLNIQ